MFDRHVHNRTENNTKSEKFLAMIVPPLLGLIGTAVSGYIIYYTSHQLAVDQVTAQRLVTSTALEAETKAISLRTCDAINILAGQDQSNTDPRTVALPKDDILSSALSGLGLLDKDNVAFYVELHERIALLYTLEDSPDVKISSYGRIKLKKRNDSDDQEEHLRKSLMNIRDIILKHNKNLLCSDY